VTGDSLVDTDRHRPEHRMDRGRGGPHERRGGCGRCTGVLSPQVPREGHLPHSDNGSEPTPGHLTRFCGARDITFTHSRSYHKNDNPHVEEKNNAVIRTFVGYDRHDRQGEEGHLD
jgi:transposase InsO family protein